VIIIAGSSKNRKIIFASAPALRSLPCAPAPQRRRVRVALPAHAGCALARRHRHLLVRCAGFRAASYNGVTARCSAAALAAAACTARESAASAKINGKHRHQSAKIRRHRNAASTKPRGSTRRAALARAFARTALSGAAAKVAKIEWRQRISWRHRNGGSGGNRQISESGVSGGDNEIS